MPNLLQVVDYGIWCHVGCVGSARDRCRGRGGLADAGAGGQDGRPAGFRRRRLHHGRVRHQERDGRTTSETDSDDLVKWSGTNGDGVAETPHSSTSTS